MLTESEILDLEAKLKDSKEECARLQAGISRLRSLLEKQEAASVPVTEQALLQGPITQASGEFMKYTLFGSLNKPPLAETRNA